MGTVVALLRAVNVGGTGRLAMADLRTLCTRLGYEDVRTYIQSGNLVLRTDDPPATVRQDLETALREHLGAPVDVVVRTGNELRALADAIPFPDADGARVSVLVGNDPVPRADVEAVVSPDGEEVVCGEREVYVHYPNGMGRSRLRLPSTLGVVTARNMNTIRRLVGMVDDLAAGTPAHG
ncbi:DUF1697 domain-containing protein [Sanguibacter suaedae]|uniref:DUF1697 domain-containing protein n=1 Tax=Sanguibacter suaedae TaxID=2795737 RepID=A0A934MEH0_9MICO|nr:DUF1697 domain-containing protein [Sanguibacter suaedae]MBI9115679.1 DUF1697 domain-containing protein [Sanguibacter suaedae]